MTMTNAQQFNPTVAGYYLAVLRSKYFYASIGVAAVSWIAMRFEAWDLIQSYLQFGGITVPYHEQVLAFFAILYRYSVPLTEEGILGYFTLSKALQPVEDAKFADFLPAGVAWARVWLQFEDNENVMITVGQYRRGASYADMGMADKRGKAQKPNLQWQFLLLLAKKGGELSFKDSEADDKWVKQKELLSKKLKSYFRMESDPFFPYMTKYKIRLMLMAPEKTEAVVGRLSGEKPHAEVFRSQEVKEDFESQSSQVNDTDETNEAWHESQGRDPRIRVWHSDE
jgi:hypothetical protein